MQKQRAESPLRLLAGAVTGTQSGLLETEPVGGTLHWSPGSSFLCGVGMCGNVPQLSAPGERGIHGCLDTAQSSLLIIPHKVSPAICTQMWLSWNVRWCLHLQLGLEDSLRP